MKSIFVGADGRPFLKEMDRPICREGSVVVKTAFSLISSGTEREILANQDKRKEIEAPLGYSASGRVVEAGHDIDGTAVGNIVACSGLRHARHAEYIAVPKNLFVNVPDGVSEKEAAFVTIGCIAVHAIRQARLSFGESALVVGAGLVGNIVAQICNGVGYRTIVTDVDARRLSLMRESGIEDAVYADRVSSVVDVLTERHGVDATLLCLHTKQSTVIDDALRATRARGRVVIVGDFPVSATRELLFQKEIELSISRAYGPGRYDPRYEEEGQDYPYEYVRWTENRNMQEFMRLLQRGVVKVNDLVAATFPIDEFAEAYRLVGGEGSKPATLFSYA